MPVEERRELVLDAAVAAFAEGGYAGTTTDQVARRAGVSQPYVVRMFGTKQALFLAAHARVMGRITDEFAAAAVPGAGEENLRRIGGAYARLISDRDVLRVMQHGFTLGADPELGPAMRESLLGIVRQIRELSGADIERTRDFLAQGMLINTLVALQLAEYSADDPEAEALCTLVLEPKGLLGNRLLGQVDER
ncbi:TetR family transcriptional regulator [Pseudonocardia ailaonensis]|uniref:TetR family transcriptional regulator n=2 Tax=Pseudonocardia ailaonensis TaxID=367279 RepID=A0ABN2N329_9PSEU